MKLSVIFFYFFALALPVVRAEVYSSASDMKQVFQLEREMVSILGGFASKLHAKLNRINDYLKVRALDMHLAIFQPDPCRTFSHLGPVNGKLPSLGIN
jgi:hypothetical protein